MPPVIELTWASSPYRLDAETSGVRIRVEAACASGLSPKIFAYRLLPVSPQTGEQQGFFDHVCSPADLAEYPEDAPRVGEAPPWFRLAFVDVLVRSTHEAENLLEAVQQDVALLQQALQRLDQLTPGGELAFGGHCPEPPGSSASLSASSSSSFSCGAVQSVTAVATSETTTGPGRPWEDQGSGAGTGLGDSESLSPSLSRVVLHPGEASRLLLLQGFDLSGIPDDAEILGFEARLAVRTLTVTANPPQLSYLSLQHQDLGLAQNRATDTPITGPGWQSLLHGGDSDRWGYQPLSGWQLKRGEFGISVVIWLPGVLPLHPEQQTIEVDGAELTVYFHECEAV